MNGCEPDVLWLGLDAGGTATRWALGDAQRRVRHEGQAAGLSGLQLADDSGRAALRQTLLGIAQAVHAAAPAARVAGLLAGITGLDAAQPEPMRQLLAHSLALPEAGVRVMSDIELVCHAAFAPGAGIVVYAGTGSIAAFVDARGTLHRAGGRGALIDDAGGGHWIAREALRRIWRAEDEAPGAWRQSPLAQAVFAHVGGSEWADTRRWAYGATRGELGLLALAVARVADEDPAALALLQAAGRELGRLAHALLQRCGPHPVALAGRVADLHTTIEQHLRQALPPGTTLQRLTQPLHHAAAALAAGAAQAAPAAHTATEPDPRTAE